MLPRTSSASYRHSGKVQLDIYKEEESFPRSFCRPPTYYKKGENSQKKVGRFGNYPLWPSLKSALRPPPSARAESANFRPFYVKRADFSPPPPATKKGRKLVKIRPRCPHLATKKGQEVVKNRLWGGWWVNGPSPSFCSIL